jgi:hypothetical protein
VLLLGIDLFPLLRLPKAHFKLNSELPVVLGTATFWVIQGNRFSKTNGLGQQRILADNGVIDLTLEPLPQCVNDVSCVIGP